MAVSRVNGRPRAPGVGRTLGRTLAVVCLLAALAGGAMRGTAAEPPGGPVQLTPNPLAPPKPAPVPPAAGTGPGAIPPAPAQPGAAAAQPGQVPGQIVITKPVDVSQPEPPEPADGGVQVGRLQGIDPESAGVLGPGQGGLGSAMWDGMDRPTVERLLGAIPIGAASAAMRGLMRRLLLTAAITPKGDLADGQKSRSLIAKRIGLLAAMGDADGVRDLLAAVPGRAGLTALDEAEAEARLLVGDNGQACQLAVNQTERAAALVWRKLSAFCQVLAGKRDEARFEAEMLAEEAIKDRAYLKLLDGLINSAPVTLESLPKPSALHLAMARVAEAALPPDVVVSDNPGILRAIALSPYANVAVRLEAAERAAAAGALSPETLRQVYGGIEFTGDELSNALSTAEMQSGPRGRALLYRVAMAQKVPTARAEAVALALKLARRGGRFGQVAQAFLPLLADIPPSGALLWFAPEAARAMLVTGETKSLGRWFALLRVNAEFDAATKTAYLGLLPLARLAGLDEGLLWRTEDLISWWQGAKGQEGAMRQAIYYHVLFSALGEPVPAAFWRALLGGGTQTTVAMPDPVLWSRLPEAAKQGHIGETVLLSLLALGEAGIIDGAPVTVARVVGALKTVGLERAARAIAVEAAVAGGL